MTVWAGVLSGVAVLALVVIPSWGAIKFKPHRARNVKYAESDVKFIQHVVEVRQEHPEIIKVARLDRHWFFVIPHLSVFSYSICVFLGANLTSNVIAMSVQARYTMATCFLVGSALVLTGSSLGQRVGPWRLAPDVTDHLTAEVLGDDIVFPYRLSMAGMGAMTVSLTIYAWTSFQSTTGSLGGWLTGGLAAACALTVATFYRATKVFEKWDHILISEAMARIEAGDDAD